MIKQLLSLQQISYRNRLNYIKMHKQNAQAIAEFILTFPVVMMVGAAIIHFGLLATAKSNLDYAAFMAARVASTTTDFGITSDPNSSPLIRQVLKRMHASDTDGYDLDDADDDLLRVELCITNPSIEAFNDWGVDKVDSNGVPYKEIPNDNLPYREAVLGGSSQATIQDANVLQLKVAYLYDTGISGLNIGHPVTRTYGGDGDHPLRMHVEGLNNQGGHPNATQGMWVRSKTAVVMQLASTLNNNTRPYIAHLDANGDPVCDGFPE